MALDIFQKKLKDHTSEYIIKDHDGLTLCVNRAFTEEPLDEEIIKFKSNIDVMKYIVNELPPFGGRIETYNIHEEVLPNPRETQGADYKFMYRIYKR